MRHADAVCVGYAEETWPQLLRDFAAGRMQRRYDQGHDFALTNLPFARRDLLDGRHFLTQAVFEATRACAHDCEFCVVPTAWGRKQFQKPVGHVVEDIRRVGKRRIIFIDLNLISDRAYAMELFEALVPLQVRWFGLATSLIGRDAELMQLMAKSGCGGLLIGLESICDASLRDIRKRFNDPSLYRTLIADLHALGISVQGCFVFGNDHDDTDAFDRTVAVRDRRGHRPAALCDPHPVPGHAAARAARPRRPHPDQELGALRRPARGVPAQADDAAAAAGGPRTGVARGLLVRRRSCAGWRRRAPSCRSP